MESWSYNSVVKGFLSDQSLPTAPTFFKPQLCSLPNELNFDNQIFGDISFPPLMNNSASQNAFSKDHESKSRQSGLIDLKLGRIDEQKDAQISQNLSLSSSKRSEQKGSVWSSTPFCKVYGCNKNLSNCKEYYKRHKVCEVHSKTSKVIVNGIEQRFCQQCSRFHLLREFDDGKRSCRKRLAGHNERRRKPRVGPFFERHGRLLPIDNNSVQGNECKESAGAISSFANPIDLHSSCQQMQQGKVRWHMDLEDKSAHDLQSTSGITDAQLHSTYVSPCTFESRFINECIQASVSSTSESAHSLLSSQSVTTSSRSSRVQTLNSQSHTVFLGSHDLNPMVGLQGNLVRFGIMYCDDRDESCMIDLLRLSSHLDSVEHHKRVASELCKLNSS